MKTSEESHKHLISLIDILDRHLRSIRITIKIIQMPQKTTFEILNTTPPFEATQDNFKDHYMISRMATTPLNSPVIYKQEFAVLMWVFSFLNVFRSY